MSGEANALKRVLAKLWATETLAGVAAETRGDFFRIYSHLEHTGDQERRLAALDVVGKLMIAIAEDDAVKGATCAIALMLLCEKYPQIAETLDFAIPAEIGAWVN